jgi:hypothetical protein
MVVVRVVAAGVLGGKTDVDFGIARNIDDISGLTTTNMTVGTVAYAAPEQLMGEAIDGRADQYALAATACHLLTGSHLYPHSNPAVVISRHLSAFVPELSCRRPDLVSLDPVLAAALAKDPADRFEQCSDFARALAEQVPGGQGRKPAAPTTPAPVSRSRASRDRAGFGRRRRDGDMAPMGGSSWRVRHIGGIYPFDILTDSCGAAALYRYPGDSTGSRAHRCRAGTAVSRRTARRPGQHWSRGGIVVHARPDEQHDRRQQRINRALRLGAGRILVAA